MGGFADLGQREWLQTEAEGAFPGEKLREVLVVLLVVAVCQNTPLEINIQANMPKSRFWDLLNMIEPLVRQAVPVWGAGGSGQPLRFVTHPQGGDGCERTFVKFCIFLRLHRPIPCRRPLPM